MTARFIRSFPWRSLQAISRTEVNALDEVKRWASSHVRLDRLGAALSDLLGTRVEVLVDRAEILGVPRGLEDGVGVLFARADTPDASRSALVEVEGALAASGAARVLKRAVPRVFGPTAAPSVSIAGAMAAVGLAAVRRANVGAAMRVLAAGPAPVLERDMARLVDQPVAVLLTILVEGEAFSARVVIARALAVSPTVSRWGADSLATLGAIPLSLPIVVRTASASAAELATLRRGDALVLPDGLGPSVRINGGEIRGRVLLASPASLVGLIAEFGEDGRLVLLGGVDPVAATEMPMVSDEKEAIAEALGDVPIVVRIEIGEARMTAREWASLGRGDVVSLGRRVGEPVLLRAGGIALARGELVDVDGEVGVRILDRLLGERPAP